MASFESRVPSPGYRVPTSILAVAVGYAAAHLAFLAPSLEDIDSINFALGLRDFDVASHQPHPPGYPLYIALGRVALAVINALAPALDQVRAEAIALSVWSALGGAIAICAAFWVFVAIERARSSPPPKGVHPFAVVPFGATLFLAASPLFWLTGQRPMSDAIGLAAALVAQACLVRGFTNRRSLIVGALVAGLAAGIRTQTIWLTVPLLVWALIEQRRAGTQWLMSRPLPALVAGGLAWGVPLLVASGGVAAYMRALGSQAGEDFAWVDMLWANPTPRRLAFALYETFVLPWHFVPLAVAVLVFAGIGGLVLLLRERRTLSLLVVAFAPYLLFHLLLQETVTTRYALPIVPAVAWLAMRGAMTAGRLAPVVAAAFVAGSIVVAVPASIAYGHEAAPAFRAIDAMLVEAAHRKPDAVYAHFAQRRPLQAAPFGLPVVEPQRNFEWLGLVDYWRSGRTGTVWFLADPRRTDLALIDPRSRRKVQTYRWAVADRGELAGTRPVAADWYRFEPPGWFAGEGWALTAETGGIAEATGKGVDRGPIDAFVRRQPGPMHMVIGGRHLGPPGDARVIFRASIDGSVVHAWRHDPAGGARNFLEFIDIPGGIPEGTDAYARLTVAAESERGSRPAVSIRQFDIQPAGTLIYGFAEGWHEDEYDNATGLHWRWTSGRSLLRVAPFQALELVLRGESPLRYFDQSPTIRVTAGGRTIAQLRPSRDFEWSVVVPAEDVRSARGAIAIETDRVYLPGQAEGTSDERELGLRLFEIRVNPVEP